MADSLTSNYHSRHAKTNSPAMHFQYLHDLCLVWTLKGFEDSTALDSSWGQLGDRVSGILFPSPRQSDWSAILQSAATEGVAGNYYDDCVCGIQC